MGVNPFPLLDLTDPAQQTQYVERVNAALTSCTQVDQQAAPVLLLYLPTPSQVLFVNQGSICLENLADYLTTYHYEFASELCTELVIEVHGRPDKPAVTTTPPARRGVTA